MKTPFVKTIQQAVERALSEDIGDGDKTAALLRPAPARARIVSREAALLCGSAWVDEVFRQLGAQGARVSWRHRDGDMVKAGTVLCEIIGPVNVLLTGERTALNFLQTLCAVATRARQFVDAVRHTRCRILDTRKTIPGLRHAQKYAVRCGGGENHRFGLYDAILIKENHIDAAGGSIAAAVTQAREKYPAMFIEVEVENLNQLEQALATGGCDRVLLDNFNIEQLKTACDISRGRCRLEASGNITLENAAAVAETGVDYISVGDITKHIRAVDLSIRVVG